jgi:hypothetical protein
MIPNHRCGITLQSFPILVVSRIIIASGMETHPTDIFYDAIVETSSTLNKANNCTDYELKGKFVNGTADISNLATIAMLTTCGDSNFILK